MTIQLTDLIFQKKNVFTKEECDFLISEHAKIEGNDTLEHCPDANTGIDTYSSFQRASLVPGSEAWKLVFKANENMINEYMDYLDSFGMFHKWIRGSMMYSHMYRLLKYETGTKIHPHTDHIPFVYGSCTFNLNDDYTGGDFVFWNGKHRLKLETGEGLIFPADYFWVHEVEEITSGTRWSTNSFLLNTPEPLIQRINQIMEREEQSREYQEYVRQNAYKIRRPT
jgi:2OG-Fe(II) oxygenase superfamily